MYHKEIKKGVPQTPILNPLFYVNDLAKCSSIRILFYLLMIHD